MTTLYKGPATLILDGGTSVEVTVLVQGRQEIHDTTTLEPGGYREYTPGFQEWWGSYSLDNEDDSDTIFRNPARRTRRHPAHTPRRTGGTNPAPPARLPRHRPLAPPPRARVGRFLRGRKGPGTPTT